MHDDYHVGGGPGVGADAAARDVHGLALGGDVAADANDAGIFAGQPLVHLFFQQRGFGFDPLENFDLVHGSVVGLRRRFAMEF